jgi:hypothetical protein
VVKGGDHDENKKDENSQYSIGIIGIDMCVYVAGL